MSEGRRLLALARDPESAAAQAREHFRAWVLAERASGRTFRSIADEVGLHFTRICQICEPNVYVREKKRTAPPPPEHPNESAWDRDMRLAREHDGY